MELIIATHALKHGIGPEEIEYAWNNFLRRQYRGAPQEGEIIAVGMGRSGQLIELVAEERPFGIVVFHAMHPPTNNMLSELGLARRSK